MASEVITILRWSDCAEELLPSPPDFLSESLKNYSEDFVTTTQIADHGDCAEIHNSPPKKKVCQDKFSKQEALNMVETVSNHAEAAQRILELLADRTFTDVSGDDLAELGRKQNAVRLKLDRLCKEVNTRKFRHIKAKVIIY